MQAHSHWTPPTGTLGVIVAEAKLRAEALESQRAAFAARATDVARGPTLEFAIRRGRDVSVIAEVKRRSPSKGVIAVALDVVAQARAYAEAGAAAISVLTEPKHFGGSNDDLLAVRAAVAIPVLKKDFHVAPIQLLEARALGASTALVIVRALSPHQLQQMLEAGHEVGIELLLEVRTLDEFERVMQCDTGASLIGVNNRDLETLVIDPGSAERVIPQLPDSITAIAESGIAGRSDVDRYARCGADAVLVGSLLSGATDPVAATRALVGSAKVGRAH